MTADERLAIIRDRARQKTVLYPATAKRERYWVPRGNGVILSNSRIGELRPDRLNRPSEWLRNAAEQPAKGLKTPNRKGAHHLTKIAELLPAKLPVIFPLSA